MSRIDDGLFNAHEHALEREYEVCPQCGSELHILNGKRGQFLGCQSYPACDYSRPLSHKEVGIIEVMEDQPCPQCERPLALKSGRYGIYIGCTGYPECEFTHENDFVFIPTVNSHSYVAACYATRPCTL